jgi:WD40 repeat protein
MPIDPAQFKVAKDLSRPDIMLCLALVPGGQRVFAGSSDGNVYHFDLATEKPEGTAMEGHKGYVTGVAVAGKQVVSGAYDGQLIWWDAESRTKVRGFKAHDRWVRNVIASRDDKLIASVADDMVCRVWDSQTGKLKHELKGHEAITPTHFGSMLYACAFSNDGSLLATGDKVGHVVVWDVKTGKSLATLEVPEVYTWDPKGRIHSIGGIRSLAFSSDNTQLAVGGMGKVGNIDHLEGKAHVEVFDWRKQERLAKFTGEKSKGLITHLAYHPQGDWLLGAGGDSKGLFMFLDITGSKILREEPAPTHFHRFTLDETGARIYTAGHNKLTLWEARA